MKKIFIISILSLLLASCSNDTSNNNFSGDYSSRNTTQRTEFENISSSLNEQIGKVSSSGNTQITENHTNYNNENENLKETNTNNTPNVNSNNQSSRELLASYSTKVYTKTADRQKNLRIVCEKLSRNNNSSKRGVFI